MLYLLYYSTGFHVQYVLKVLILDLKHKYCMIYLLYYSTGFHVQYVLKVLILDLKHILSSCTVWAILCTILKGFIIWQAYIRFLHFGMKHSCTNLPCKCHGWYRWNKDKIWHFSQLGLKNMYRHNYTTHKWIGTLFCTCTCCWILVGKVVL